MDDYKNSKEGRIVAAKYADILHKSRPEPSFKHPRMSLSNRAKIFSPFAALRGYEEEIADEKWKQMRVSKKILYGKNSTVLRNTPTSVFQFRILGTTPTVLYSTHHVEVCKFRTASNIGSNTLLQ